MAKGIITESFATESKQEFKGKKLRIAIVGFGGIAVTHMRAFAKMPEVEIVAAVDTKQDRLDLAAKDWNIAGLYTDWKKMLKEVKPDAVDVCTPNGLHAPAVIDAVNAGAHALTEKPMAMNPAECEKMIAAANKNKKVLALGFQYRFHPNTQYIKRARDEGQFGNIMFMKCQALRRRGIPNWGVFGQKQLQGGGPMIDIGVHVIEMAHYIMGSPRPVAAQGNVWTYMGNKKSDVISTWPNWDYKTYTVEDLAIGQIRFDNGAIMQIEASFAAHIEKDVWNFTMVGDKGGATWDPPQLFTDRAGTMVNEKPNYIPESGPLADIFHLKLKNWVDAINTGSKLEAPAQAGLDVMKIIDGIYRSAAAKKEVAIK